MQDLFKYIQEGIKEHNFIDSVNHIEEIDKMQVELNENFYFSKSEMLIDLDISNATVESYIEFSFNTYVKIYNDNNEAQPIELTINEIVIGGLTVILLDSQETDIKNRIANLLIFA